MLRYALTLVTTVHATISAMQGRVSRGYSVLHAYIFDQVRATFLHTTTEAVVVPLANKYILVDFLQLANNDVHPIDRLLERLEVFCDGHDISIKS